VLDNNIGNSAMDKTLTDTIDRHSDPLAFKLHDGKRSPLAQGGNDVIKVEARQMALHQKEGVATDGAGACAWRLATDEGKHLKGTDLAPFPLGFFNAGIEVDLAQQIRWLAAERGIAVDGLSISVVNHYWLTGSFIHGTGEGHAEAPDIEVRVDSPADPNDIVSLVNAAMDASPAIAFLRAALTTNTFALYINGRRRTVEGALNSSAPDASDPYRTYRSAPRPLDPGGRANLIVKTGASEAGQSAPAQATIQGKQLRNIHGEGRLTPDGLFEVDTWLGMPGASHFRIVGDTAGDGRAPSGMALFAAGISFCYMTQLARYIENMKLAIRGVRLVQFTPFTGGVRAVAGPIDTHLFLNGEAPDEIHLKLLTVAERTCYLHAASKTPTEPILRIVHNGRPVARAA
jgi:uncharacterized OsmC-like protein